MNYPLVYKGDTFRFNVEISTVVKGLTRTVWRTSSLLRVIEITITCLQRVLHKEFEAPLAGCSGRACIMACDISRTYIWIFHTGYHERVRGMTKLSREIGFGHDDADIGKTL